ncbi:hypothetical protein BB14905_18555 [Bacillus sp. B14905]|nr:hypothetical protein BB14905_18555 [Bacillus sp. B14905]
MKQKKVGILSAQETDFFMCWNNLLLPNENKSKTL